MIDVAEKWGATQAPTLIAQRENAVYRVNLKGQPYALRMHRKGYQTSDAIRAELAWTTRLAEVGFPCPKAVADLSGDVLVDTPDGGYASMIAWVDGAPIGGADQPAAMSVQAHCDLYRRVGVLLAQLHTATDQMDTSDIIRPKWDRDGLVGKSPFWGRFWENPSLSTSEKKFLKYARDAANAQISAMLEPDYGLIHADALQENIFDGPDGLVLIDFDDCGFGYRGYDLGVALSQHYTKRYWSDLATALVDGYGSLRPAPSIDDVRFFMMLRSFASCGWVISRVPKKSPQLRTYAERAIHLAHQWLT